MSTTNDINLAKQAVSYSPTCKDLKPYYSVGADCNTEKGRQFENLVRQQAQSQGIPLAGLNILGCNVRNFENSQLPDRLSSDLSNVDAVVFFNITGTNISYDVFPSINKTGLVVLSLMCEDGGSHINFKIHSQPSNKVGYRHYGRRSGGSGLKVSGLDFGAIAHFEFNNHGGSDISLEAKSSQARFKSTRLGGSSFSINGATQANPVGDFDSGAIAVP